MSKKWRFLFILIFSFYLALSFLPILVLLFGSTFSRCHSLSFIVIHCHSLSFIARYSVSLLIKLVCVSVVIVVVCRVEFIHHWPDKGTTSSGPTSDPQSNWNELEFNLKVKWKASQTQLQAIQYQCNPNSNPNSIESYPNRTHQIQSKFNPNSNLFQIDSKFRFYPNPFQIPLQSEFQSKFHFNPDPFQILIQSKSIPNSNSIQIPISNSIQIQSKFRLMVNHYQSAAKVQLHFSISAQFVLIST